MPYGFKEKEVAEEACRLLNERKGNAHNKFVVSPYEEDNGEVVTWGAEHWYIAEPGEWRLNGHMWLSDHRPVQQE